MVSITIPAVAVHLNVKSYKIGQSSQKMCRGGRNVIWLICFVPHNLCCSLICFA